MVPDNNDKHNSAFGPQYSPSNFQELFGGSSPEEKKDGASDEYVELLLLYQKTFDTVLPREMIFASTDTITEAMRESLRIGSTAPVDALVAVVPPDALI